MAIFVLRHRETVLGEFASEEMEPADFRALRCIGGNFIFERKVPDRLPVFLKRDPLDDIAIEIIRGRNPHNYPSANSNFQQAKQRVLMRGLQ